MSYPLTPICLQILNGSKIATPVRATSAVLRVTNINPCTLAVAASNPSMSGKGSGTLKSAQASAIGSSIGSTLSPSRVRICANQRSKAAACSASRRRFSSMPRRISARTRTLVPISLTGVCATHFATFGSVRSSLRISDMTFVSSRNFKGRPLAISFGAAGRIRPRRPLPRDRNRRYRRRF